MKTLLKLALACVLAVGFVAQNVQAVPDPFVTNTAFTVTSGKTVATIVGSCVSTQNLGMSVNVYWGLTDYGSTTASWSHTNSIGLVTSGQSFATVLSPLVPGNTYYWNCIAVDSLTNTSYLATSGSFTTGGIVGPAAGSLLTNAVITSTVTVGGTKYATSYSTINAGANTGTATWTPAYRTISLLDSSTNAVSLIICTNMPAVTAVTNAVGAAKGVFTLTP